MKAYYSDIYELPLPEAHRFPMAKYRLLRERVSAELFQVELNLPRKATRAELELAHAPDYIAKIFAGGMTDREIRVLGFPWSEKLVERSCRSVGATMASLESAFEQGVAVNLAGGTHHAGHDQAQGFCVFNDNAIAARFSQQQGWAKHPLVIDCDVHQGNGTASIFVGDPTVYTFSIHGKNNFPLKKACSDWDIELDDGAGDDQYLTLLQDALNSLPQRFTPDCVLYIAGADPFARDKLGKLDLSKAGLSMRDRLVYQFCDRHGLPLAVSMAGGYAADIEDIVDIHFQTVASACEYADRCRSRFADSG